VERPIFTDT